MSKPEKTIRKQTMKLLNQHAVLTLWIRKATGLFKKQVKLLTSYLRLLMRTEGYGTQEPHHTHSENMPQQKMFKAWNLEKKKIGSPRVCKILNSLKILSYVLFVLRILTLDMIEYYTDLGSDSSFFI